MLEKKNLLGVGITNATRNNILEYITKGLEKDGKKYFIVTPNPEILVIASKDPKYKSILNSAELALPDGVGVMLGAKILGVRFKERVTGVNFLESLCSKVAKKPITVGFLGGRDFVAERTAECLRLKYPHLKIAFAGSEWLKYDPDFKKRFKIYDLRFKNKREKFINHPTIDVLFVAFGAPKQEMWISENLDKLPVRVAMGVGGAFDYISGKVSRPPIWVQKIGLEWFYRLVREPWRIKRQLALLEFILLVLKEKIKNLK